MHILSLRRLREFWAEHPDAEASLRAWYRVAKQARWQRFTDVRAHYRSADQVGKFTVFNIAGNAYRLITVIHFKPTVCLDVISLLASSCGYNRGEIEQRVAH
jgi:mRNA interferase HigB